MSKPSWEVDHGVRVANSRKGVCSGHEWWRRHRRPCPETPAAIRRPVRPSSGEAPAPPASKAVPRHGCLWAAPSSGFRTHGAPTSIRLSTGCPEGVRPSSGFGPHRVPSNIRLGTGPPQGVRWSIGRGRRPLHGADSHQGIRWSVGRGQRRVHGTDSPQGVVRWSAGRGHRRVHGAANLQRKPLAKTQAIVSGLIVSADSLFRWA
mmetsp:Transcript_95724/g.308757  ORF Transcript_95724/g.308757 Transcript_95724/m.308757 type:complete len:205 (+) Transcript_95724:99-713(+)